MSALAERLAAAKKRGWSNAAHLAELRDLLQLPAANDAEAPLIEAPLRRAIDTYDQWLCDPPPGLTGAQLLEEATKAARAAAMEHRDA